MCVCVNHLPWLWEGLRWLGQHIQTKCARTTGPEYLGKRVRNERQGCKIDYGLTAKGFECHPKALGLYPVGNRELTDVLNKHL